MLSLRTFRATARSAGALFIALAASTSSAHAQALGSINRPITVTVCELRSHYQRYAGKFISFRATLHPGFEVATYSDGSCTTGVPIEDPSDPLVKPEPHFRIRKDASLEKYENTPTDPPFLVNGDRPTATYKLTATYTGRLDVASPKALGYGHLNISRARLVLFSISDVVAELSHEATPPEARGWHVPPGNIQNIQMAPPTPPNVYPSGSPQ